MAARAASRESAPTPGLAPHPPPSRNLAAVIEEEIVLGWLQPRERLVEEDLAARYGVKRHAVREAIFALERIGLVERVPNKGAVVRMLRAVDVEQIYAVREALEAFAATLIPLPAADLIARLETIQERHSAAVESDDARAAFRANMDFHDTLFSACGNPHLAEAIKSFAQKVHGVRSYTAGDPAYLARAREEHMVMIEALRAGDRERLMTLCKQHLGPSRDIYIAMLARRQGR
ncbi:GntR family transcriptional regulator [Xanthobacteraceae bacterium Astr-EGSB]|uniref:GntR family transcriptional regulator n=1 Tax=Astrobacterium formosum TaxID=3069710 RepID=UPI0027B77746|nr:GntR family transcriptional regulator [Xanthobacteraceae bacterium Astr-EGSB]